MTGGSDVSATKGGASEEVKRSSFFPPGGSNCPLESHLRSHSGGRQKTLGTQAVTKSRRYRAESNQENPDRTGTTGPFGPFCATSTPIWPAVPTRPPRAPRRRAPCLAAKGLHRSALWRVRLSACRRANPRDYSSGRNPRSVVRFRRGSAI